MLSHERLPSVIDLPQPTGSDLWTPEESAEFTPLHRPARAFVAVGEVVFAAVAVWLAFICWPDGILRITTTLTDGTQLTSTRYVGSWIAGAIGLGLLAALLLVDAVRQLLLAVRARHRKPYVESTVFTQPTHR
jgi:hypothetical protein